VLPLAALYCLVQAVRDVRRKQHVAAAIGAALAVAILVSPIRTHAVKIDLPQPVRQ
jgi:hypothetical protein